MERPVRNNLIFGIVAFILGAILLSVGIAAQPDRDLHTGFVVLDNQTELDAFSTSVLMNDVSRRDFTISGSDFPYIVSLDVITTPNSAFAYGDIKPLSAWYPLPDSGMIGNFVVKLLGIMFLLVGAFYIIIMTLTPKWATHSPRIKAEWIPYPKKDDAP